MSNVVLNPLAIPLISYPETDEFTADVLDPKWTQWATPNVYNPGPPPTESYRRTLEGGRLVYQPRIPNQGGWIVGLQEPVPAESSWVFETRCHIEASTAVGQILCGIGLWPADSSKIFLQGIYRSGGGLGVGGLGFNPAGQYVGPEFRFGVVPMNRYFRVGLLNGKIQVFSSEDGFYYVLQYTYGAVGWLGAAPAFIGPACGADQASENTTRYVFDYFRRLA